MWVISPVEKPKSAEVFAEDRGNLAREVEKRSYKYQPRLHTGPATEMRIVTGPVFLSYFAKKIICMCI